jgi:TQXA domain-containing protein
MERGKFSMKQCISTSALLTSIFIFIAAIFMMPISAQATTNTTDKYVGYYNTNVQSQISSRAWVYSLYVTPMSNYQKYRGGTVDNSKVEVAYCFSKNKYYPGNIEDGYWWENTDKGSTKVDGYTVYNKVENATGQEFLDNAVTPFITNAEDFRAKILSIGLNGYPYDYSGFNKDSDGNNIISDSAFRTLTQYAIWYYTDSDNTISYRTLTSDEEIILKELIETTLPQYITDRAVSAIDLYVWDGNSAFGDSATIYKADGTMTTAGAEGYKDRATQPEATTGYVKGYQNLLAVHTEALTQIANLSAPITLTLSKATTGGLSGKFTFNISLEAGTTYWVNSQTADNVKDDKNGNLTVTLESGESVSVKIANATSYSYTIEETNASAYKTSITVKKGAGTVSATNSKAISGKDVATDTSILYTNTGTNEPTRYPMFFRDDDDNSDDDDDEEREREYENMDNDTKTIWEIYMESRYGDDITIDRYGYVWKDNNIVDTIPSKKGSPDFTKKTVKLTEGDTVPDDETTSPKTADSSNLAFWLGLAVICGLVLARKLRSRMK